MDIKEELIWLKREVKTLSYAIELLAHKEVKSTLLEGTGRILHKLNELKTLDKINKQQLKV